MLLPTLCSSGALLRRARGVRRGRPRLRARGVRGRPARPSEINVDLRIFVTGSVLVGVTSPYNGRGAGMRAYNANHSMTGWEVDEHAQVRAKLTIPHPYDQSKAKGGYRLLPWKSVGGESPDAPTSGC